MINFIREKQNRHFSKYGIEIFVKDKIVYDVSMNDVIDGVLDVLPNHLFDNIDSIRVGQFLELEDRKLQAMYKDRIIYLTNTRKTKKEMIGDIVHEVAHSIEEQFQKTIFSDNKIANEFLQKRKKLFDILTRNGYTKDKKYFKNLNYDKSFDMFLYEEVGYSVLRSLTANLFYSPYAATSLREYFANAFEKFFIKSAPPRLKNISPEAYKKIVLISENKTTPKGEKNDF
tara:strand:+ start:7345 stop:8031 length:687 start_codon:yes stop_codon:yes gene_type:complete